MENINTFISGVDIISKFKHPKDKKKNFVKPP